MIEEFRGKQVKKARNLVLEEISGRVGWEFCYSNIPGRCQVGDKDLYH